MRQPDVIDIYANDHAAIRSFDIHSIPDMMQLGRFACEDPVICALSLCTDDIGQIVRQGMVVFRNALKKHSPGKLWADADRRHPSIARALKIDPADENAFYALLPFRLAKIGEQYHILAAMPPPPIGVTDFWHIDIETVAAWNPVSNTVHIVGDEQPRLIMPPDDTEELNIYGDPYKFFRAWAEQRAIWADKRRDVKNNRWAHPARERPQQLPGALIVGDIKTIRWPKTTANVVNVIGADKKAINAAIFKAAKLPNLNGE